MRARLGHADTVGEGGRRADFFVSSTAPHRKAGIWRPAAFNLSVKVYRRTSFSSLSKLFHPTRTAIAKKSAHQPVRIYMSLIYSISRN